MGDFKVYRELAWRQKWGKTFKVGSSLKLFLFCALMNVGNGLNQLYYLNDKKIILQKK